MSQNSKIALTAFIDGACKGNPGPGASAAALFADGERIAKKTVVFANTTNNLAEYNALILALEAALELGCAELTVKTDSELVARQMNGRYKVKNKNIIPLNEKAKALAAKFKRFEILEIPREENSLADRLANEAMKR